MRILVTGAAGFLGSWLVDKLQWNGHEVIGIDDYSGGNYQRGISHTTTTGSICDLALMTQLCKNQEVIYHCAALPYEGLSVFSPKRIVSNIVDGTVTVGVAAARNKVKRVINCSSMARYGMLETGVFSETDTPHPVDPYGIAKLCAEQQLNVLGRVHGFEVVHAVPHNIVGPRQRYDDPYRNVVSIMANRMLQGKPAIIYGDGKQRRCFSDIQDVLPTLVSLATYTPQEHGEVFNIGPDDLDVSINELYKLLTWITDIYIPPIYVDPRPCEVGVATCSSTKIKQRFGFNREHSLTDTVRSVVDWVKQNGPKEFEYNLELEIVNEKTPKTWTQRML